MKPLGYIYVLSNEAMPGIVKIGRTERLVQDRADELHDTATPLPFRIEYQAACFNPQQAERAIHLQLSSCRVNSAREFFRVAPSDAIVTIRSILGVDLIQEEANCHERGRRLIHLWEHKEEYDHFWSEVKRIGDRLRDTSGFPRPSNPDVDYDIYAARDLASGTGFHERITPLFSSWPSMTVREWDESAEVYKRRYEDWKRQLEEVCKKLPIDVADEDIYSVWLNGCHFVYLSLSDFLSFFRGPRRNTCSQ
jgi:hypothetical protein